jgi:hypothetical protein
MEAARDAMIRAHKASTSPHEYRVGDKVKVSTRVLPIRCTSTTSLKLHPKYIGPFTVLDVDDKVVRLQLPQTYNTVHDKFNVENVRPWLHSDERTVDPDYPELQAHPSLNPVVQVLDRKKVGVIPRRLSSYLDIPAKYLVVRKDGSMEWRKGSQLTSPEERSLVKNFEFRFKRTKALPCNQVKDYDVSLAEGDPMSEDELDLAWYQEIKDYYDDIA